MVLSGVLMALAVLRPAAVISTMLLVAAIVVTGRVTTICLQVTLSIVILCSDAQVLPVLLQDKTACCVDWQLLMQQLQGCCGLCIFYYLDLTHSPAC